MAGPTVTLPAQRVVDITAVHGWNLDDDIVFVFTAVDANGAVRDITGWTLEFKLREYADDPDTVLTVAGVIVSAGGGTYKIVIADTDTSPFNAGRYSYTCRRTDAGSEETVNWGRALLMKGGAA